MKLFLGSFFKCSLVHSSSSMLQYHYRSPGDRHYKTDNESELGLAGILYLVIIGRKTKCVEGYAGQDAADIERRAEYRNNRAYELKKKHYLFSSKKIIRSDLAKPP